MNKLDRTFVEELIWTYNQKLVPLHMPIELHEFDLNIARISAEVFALAINKLIEDEYFD